ncbi:MAG TPA: YqzL family protein [Candidatus Borkfalkia excrementipullorum]|nr:YqzL family protein [Candidatus Borkfalkia excrementipullorum]
MGRFVKDDETAEIAWKLFEQTGSLSYYMLYKQLKK